MRAIVTVIGKDKTGIIARVSGFLSEKGVNIEDISQTVLQDNFAMIMLASLPEETSLPALAKEARALGESIGVEIYLQNEAVFNAMHKI